MTHNQKIYIINLIDLDRLGKKQELIKAEYRLGDDNANLYWKGRINFLKQEIKSCDDCINELNAL